MTITCMATLVVYGRLMLRATCRGVRLPVIVISVHNILFIKLEARVLRHTTLPKGLGCVRHFPLEG